VDRWTAIARRLLLLLASGSLMSVAGPREAAAAGDIVHVISVTQRDARGDERPDVTTIDCSFVTARDRVEVLDGGGDMVASTDWRRATDFLNDTWLYDIGADGSVQLIVAYGTEVGRTVAHVYDDRDGDGVVSYDISDGRVVVQESEHWTARIVSSSAWFLPDGRPNLNVRIELDGPIPTLDRAPPEYLERYMPHDGVPDVVFDEVANDDGTARYAVRRLLAASPADWGFERSALWSNEGRFPTRSEVPALFPFLQRPVDPQSPSAVDLRYFDLPPNLGVDWEKAKVASVGLAGYPIGRGYHFNNNSYIRPGELNAPSFESPQAYYDLEGDGDAFADLHVRFFTRPADEQAMWAPETARGLPWQAIGYDWNLFNPHTLTWDFKVAVAGNQTIDSVVSLGDFDIQMVPYDDLPGWVTEHEWKLATLLAREGEGYQSSEGLYEWMADTGDDPEGDPDRAVEARDATFAYMLGATADPPDEYFETAHPGFRAERRVESPGPTTLYFSPIDHKIHLLGAEAGVWNVDGQTMIRYGNVADGEYLDHWQRVEDGRSRAELYALDGWFLFADQERVVIKPVGDLGPPTHLSPPRDHQEWDSMRRLVDREQPDFPPGDFEAMLAQSPMRETSLERAAIRDVRSTDAGFRFILELRRGFRPTDDRRLPMGGLSPGTYAVEYDGQFSILPLTPADVDLSLSVSGGNESRSNSVRVRASNTGLEDVAGATIELLAAAPDGTGPGLISTQEVGLLSGATVEPRFTWVPRSQGTWVIFARVRGPEGQLVAEASSTVDVGSTGQPSPERIVTITAGSDGAMVIPVLVVTFALVVGVIAWQATRTQAA
jgi:hypothetical protein